MSTRRVLRNMLLAAVAVVAIVAAFVGVSWLRATEPWYDWDVVRQIRASKHDRYVFNSLLHAQLGDETPQVAALFPVGMDADSARSVLRSNGFACTTDPSGDFQLNCTRETHDLWFCGARYVVNLTIDGGRRVSGQRGSSYVTCL